MTERKTSPSADVWKMDATCGSGKTVGCGGKFEITQKDLFLVHDSATGSVHKYGAVRCPFCHKTIGLNVPPIVFDRLLVEDANREEAAFFTNIRVKNGF